MLLAICISLVVEPLFPFSGKYASGSAPEHGGVPSKKSGYFPTKVTRPFVFTYYLVISD
jgi:hypothetical protein